MSPEPATDREAYLHWSSTLLISMSPLPAIDTSSFLAFVCCRSMSPEPAIDNFTLSEETFFSLMSPEPVILNVMSSVLMSVVAMKSPLPNQSTLVSSGDVTFTITSSDRSAELKVTPFIFFFLPSTEMFNCLSLTSTLIFSMSLGEAMMMHSCFEPCANLTVTPAVNDTLSNSVTGIDFSTVSLLRAAAPMQMATAIMINITFFILLFILNFVVPLFIITYELRKVNVKIKVFAIFICLCITRIKELSFDKIGCISEIKIKKYPFLFCISLNLHYLCTVIARNIGTKFIV